VRYKRPLGRESVGWVKYVPKVRWVREDGREGTSWLNLSPKVRCEREAGRQGTGWLNWAPNVRCVIVDGRREVRVEGSDTGELNPVLKMMCVMPHEGRLRVKTFIRHFGR
jgi:hypothetical protein